MDTEMYCYTPSGERKDLPAEKVFDDWMDPETSAIACVDMHRSHVGEDPDIPVPAPRATERVEAHNAFHRAAREIGVPVIMVQHWQRYGGTDDLNSKLVEGGTNWRHLEKIYMNLDPENMKELGWEGTKWVDLMVEEDPRDLYVRTKKRLSSFYPTDLEFLLRQMGVKNLIINGTLTDCCVLNTAFDAANRDFRVVVPRDVAAGMSEEMENAAQSVIANHLGLVVDGPALLREWYARKGAELPEGLEQAETMDDMVAAAA